MRIYCARITPPFSRHAVSIEKITSTLCSVNIGSDSETKWQQGSPRRHKAQLCSFKNSG